MEIIQNMLLRLFVAFTVNYNYLYATIVLELGIIAID